MKTFDHLGLGIPQLLLPRAGVDLQKWAVIACDQYTSEPEYWHAVEQLVGGDPSTLRLIFPEVHLGEPNADGRIADICGHMKSYLAEEILQPHEGFVYVERTMGDRTRRGLMVCLDLEAYDYERGSGSLIRATEGTIVDRLPPRIRVREGAPLELPHIMVLLDDPDDRVIGPLAAAREGMKSLYAFDLMKDGGHLAGRALDDQQTTQVIQGLEALADPGGFTSKYGVGADQPVLLYAMGDGNHSLATAKAIWEQVKKEGASPDDPRRHALVELVNLHDDAMVFEPIHRVLFDLRRDVMQELREHFQGKAELTTVENLDALVAEVEASTSKDQRFGIIAEAGYSVARITTSDSNLPVGTLQQFLDPVVQSGGVAEVDYVHGTEAVDRLGRAPKNLGFFLPGMDKKDLFTTVILDGALPRKTFSMGEADEKRFYMECRRI